MWKSTVPRDLLVFKEVLQVRGRAREKVCQIKRQKRTHSVVESERAVDHMVLSPCFVGEEKGEETLLLLLLVTKWN